MPGNGFAQKYPPAHIAKLFHQVIGEDEFKDKFRLIDFAILDGYRTGLRNNPEGNLVPFQREFGQEPVLYAE